LLPGDLILKTGSHKFQLFLFNGKRLGLDIELGAGALFRFCPGIEKALTETFRECIE